MEGTPKKSHFLSAYEAGKKVVELRRRPFSFARTLGLAAVLIFTSEATRRLTARFQFAAFGKTLFYCAAHFLVFLIYFLYLWAPIKRDEN
jgi:hypothetical protein